MVIGMAVMRGAYDWRPYAVNMPVMNDRGDLPSPGGWRAVYLARIAILLLLLHLAESLLHLQHSRQIPSKTNITPISVPSHGGGL
jgi:hypothetical protein